MNRGENSAGRKKKKDSETSEQCDEGQGTVWGDKKISFPRKEGRIRGVGLRKKAEKLGERNQRGTLEFKDFIREQRVAGKGDTDGVFF